ncbi:HET and ankyrin domain protein [Chaetomium sp. MPI-CAGE-AT-0009]|nr:HET and ankyrin domain protein [Chaetomium sp. MPI-CAGE-AT-0009]
MRLLNTATGNLETFSDADTPLYAILSHRWTSNEITFQDLHDPHVRHKEGYSKISNSCRIAAENGLDYLWIDTCCIDKTNSTELSTAINSMYQWYRDSVVCFAYLSDVPEVDFARSLWFTRGWTLQELLAPSTVIFFRSDWSVIGLKSSPDIRRAISETTGIPTKILRGGDLSLASNAQKMSWAANRVTTVTEDLAYCLMGIFGINMPMLYGEGDKAFLRLQEEILRTTDDLSLFVWKEDGDGPERSSGLLAAHPRSFRHSGGIKRSDPFAAQSVTVDNLGIHLKVPLVTIRDREDRLALVHTEEGGRDVGIWLRPVSETSDLFQRKTAKYFHLVQHGEGIERETDRMEQQICVRRDRRSTRSNVAQAQMFRKIATMGRDETIKFILSVRAFKIDAHDASGRTLLSWAAEFGNEQVARELLRQGAMVDVSDRNGLTMTPLLWGAADGHVEMARLLLQEGADREARDKKGRSAIALAAANDDTKMAMFLLDQGVHLEAPDVDSRTCLAHAAMHGCCEVVRMVISRGADLEARDNDGLTPLALAASRGQTKAARILIEAGSNIEARDKNGWTPIFWAAGKGHRETVELLLIHDAEVNVCDHLGVTPLFQAERIQRGDIVKLLHHRRRTGRGS